MVFKEGASIGDTEIERKQGEDILHVNYLGASFVPSIAENPGVMGNTVEILVENPNISRIVFVQQRNYNYPFSQVSLLTEIARIYSFLVKQENILSTGMLALIGNIEQTYSDLTYLLNLLKQDPIACYVELKSRIKDGRDQLDSGRATNKNYLINYVRLLERFLGLLDGTKLIKGVIGSLADYKLGDRELYGDLFRPDILPNFSFSRLVAQLPKNAELVDQYKIDNEFETISVTILRNKEDSKYFYHIMPSEYELSEEQHLVVNMARNILTEHRPQAEEFTDPEKTRLVFFNVAKDLLSELAQNRGMGLSYKELNKLANILLRHTIGFGLIEVLLQDTKLQDIVLNAPIAQNNIFVRHEKYDECVTNIIPDYADADSWAAKLRLQSGRPLDEANPVLDTDLVFGNVRARVAAIKEPLSPSGLAYAFRRHRDDPWTLPLFIKNKMINSFAAGLLSFLIDGSRTLLVAGTRSSGKTSLLGSLLLEIMPRFRIICVEDSVTGDSRMIVKENGKFRETTIGELIDGKIKRNGFKDIDGREKGLNLDGVEIFSVDKSGKVVLSKPSKFIRHKVNKPIYEVLTSSGRKIKVTKDHSLFGLDEKKILKEVKAGELKEGDFIAVPRKLSFDNSLKNINLLDYIQDLKEFGKNIFVFGEEIKNYVKSNRKKVFDLAYSLGYLKSTIQNWIVKGILPLIIFEKIKDKVKAEDLFIKTEGGSKSLPCKIVLDDVFLNFVGLWLADGCCDQRSVIVSVMEDENKEVIRKIAKRFDAKVKLHSDKFSSMINNDLLRCVMQKMLGLTGNSYTKQIPQWVYDLSDRQVGMLLKGYYSGDGCASDKEIVAGSCSQELVYGISTLLTRFGITVRIGGVRKKDKTINFRIGSTKEIKLFRDNVGFLVTSKNTKLEKLCSRISTHDSSDLIPLSLDVKKGLSRILGNRFDRKTYIKCDSYIGREKLKELLNFVPVEITSPIDSLKTIVSSDIFWDKVKSIKPVSGIDYVYDISVPGNENFICENIIAHNTLELPVDALRNIGYDILRMKVRSALVSGSSEVEAAEGIRTSLRLGDSALIVGEVRSSEAKALYEAMRVGALANVVAGTIHGDSPYGVFDRVVNDLGVERTSFKATDVIIVANPVKTPDGLHSVRRVVRITEIRKHWNKDPLEEKGFVDLMKYNVETDELEPTQELINGDSEIIKSIASNVKGWAGNWDAVYDNIILRGKIKQEIVNIAEKFKNPGLLEAKFNALCNGAFHTISDRIRQEYGSPMGDMVFAEWKAWAEKTAKRI